MSITITKQVNTDIIEDKPVLLTIMDTRGAEGYSAVP